MEVADADTVDEDISRKRSLSSDSISKSMDSEHSLTDRSISHTRSLSNTLGSFDLSDVDFDISMSPRYRRPTMLDTIGNISLHVSRGRTLTSFHNELTQRVIVDDFKGSNINDSITSSSFLSLNEDQQASVRSRGHSITRERMRRAHSLSVSGLCPYRDDDADAFSEDDTEARRTEMEAAMQMGKETVLD